LVAEAKSQEKLTMCHAVGGPGLRMCIEAGVGSVEHACYLAEDPDLAKMMADKNVFFTPTFEVYEFHSTISAPHIIERTKQLMQIHQESLHMAVSAGVKVSAGTDAGGFVHGDNAREIYADFLVVDGDPLKDISVIRNKEKIKMVMKGGEAYIDNLPVGDPQAVGD